LKINAKPKRELGTRKKPKLKPTTNLLKVKKSFNAMGVKKW
jgi:hypothetical protein